MALVIDANMILFAERMNITSSRMMKDYGLSTIDEIIKEEAARGNYKAVEYAREYYESPEKLIKVFRLMDVENKFKIIKHMDPKTRMNLLPFLERDDLVMGLYFFTQDKLLDMLMKVNIAELVNVVMEAFPMAKIMQMFTEDDLAQFFMQDKLERFDVMEQLQSLPPDVMQKFIEGVTGQEATQSSKMDVFNNLRQMSDDDFRKFMSSIDPDVQRQLTFQLTTDKPEYLQLFPNKTYVDMLNTLMKPDMIAPMIMLEKETLVNMITELPDELMAIVGAQIDPKKFAIYLQKGHMDVLQGAWMI